MENKASRQKGMGRKWEGPEGGKRKQWSHETLFKCLVYITCLPNLLIRCLKTIETVSCRQKVKLNNVQRATCRGSVTIWQGGVQSSRWSEVEHEGENEMEISQGSHLPIPGVTHLEWDKTVENKKVATKSYILDMGGRSTQEETSVPRVSNKAL